MENQPQQHGYTVHVYIDNGIVYSYDVSSEAKVREHAAAIIKSGYIHNDGLVFEHYPPHRILKVKSNGISTMYPDKTAGV